MTFGERLYELRNRKNISQEELAEILDVSRQSISKWENDKAYPEMTRLLFMSDYFHVSLDYLIRGLETESGAGSKPEKYKVQNMLLTWNSFLSNLTKKQRALMLLLYVLVVCALLAIIVSVFYLGGYEIGKFIAYIQN